MDTEEPLPKDPVDLQLFFALKELVARSLIPPPGPGGYNALASQVSTSLLQTPAGREVRNLLASRAFFARTDPAHPPDPGADQVASLITSLAQAARDRSGDAPTR